MERAGDVTGTTNTKQCEQKWLDASETQKELLYSAPFYKHFYICFGFFYDLST